jgi:bacteriocin biosynthesis cyclodehydratase domain-containing protein
MEPSKSIQPVHLLSVGTFGQAATTYLRGLRADIVETVVSNDVVPLPELWPSARAMFIVAWRPVPHLCELLDDLSYTWQRPFVPVILDSTILRLGPVVIPGRGSCWGCWAQRFKQHAERPAEQAALWLYYASHVDSGPRGYLEPFALMAASRMAQVIDAIDSSTAPAGSTWEIDMMTRVITTGTVVGVHDCPRCGLHRTPSTRSFAVMREELAYLWNDLGSDAPPRGQ